MGGGAQQEGMARVAARRSALWEYAFKSMLKVVVFHPDNEAVYRKDRVGKCVCRRKDMDKI